MAAETPRTPEGAGQPEQVVDPVTAARREIYDLFRTYNTSETGQFPGITFVNRVNRLKGAHREQMGAAPTGSQVQLMYADLAHMTEQGLHYVQGAGDEVTAETLQQMHDEFVEAQSATAATPSQTAEAPVSAPTQTETLPRMDRPKGATASTPEKKTRTRAKKDTKPEESDQSATGTSEAASTEQAEKPAPSPRGRGRPRENPPAQQ